MRTMSDEEYRASDDEDAHSQGCDSGRQGLPHLNRYGFVLDGDDLLFTTRLCHDAPPAS
jgi:hypothetical protein